MLQIVSDALIAINAAHFISMKNNERKEKRLELYTLNRFSVEPLENNKTNKTLIIGFSKIKQAQIPQAVRRLKEVLWE